MLLPDLTMPGAECAKARVFPLFIESEGDSQISWDLIQTACWKGGQHAWHDLTLSIYVSAWWRR